MNETANSIPGSNGNGHSEGLTTEQLPAQLAAHTSVTTSDSQIMRLYGPRPLSLDEVEERLEPFMGDSLCTLHIAKRDNNGNPLNLCRIEPSMFDYDRLIAQHGGGEYLCRVSKARERGAKATFRFLASAPRPAMTPPPAPPAPPMPGQMGGYPVYIPAPAPPIQTQPMDLTAIVVAMIQAQAKQSADQQALLITLLTKQMEPKPPTGISEVESILKIAKRLSGGDTEASDSGMWSAIKETVVPLLTPQPPAAAATTASPAAPLPRVVRRIETNDSQAPRGSIPADPAPGGEQRNPSPLPPSNPSADASGPAVGARPSPGSAPSSAPAGDVSTAQQEFLAKVAQVAKLLIESAGDSNRDAVDFSNRAKAILGDVIVDELVTLPPAIVADQLMQIHPELSAQREFVLKVIEELDFEDEPAGDGGGA